jgi:hypothetical protein
MSSETQKLLEITFMYISSIPTMMTLRSSAVVEQEETVTEAPSSEEPSSKSIYLRVYHWYRKRNFLLRQAIVLYCLVILVTAIESTRLRTDPSFTLIKVIFECLSAFGSVGITLGYPGSVLSFSGQFTTVSKFIIVVIFILGRHRGLPTELDAAYSTKIRLTENPDLDEDANSTMVLSVNDLKLIKEDADGQRRTVIVRRTRNRQVTALL